MDKRKYVDRAKLHENIKQLPQAIVVEKRGELREP
jgi:hypothetical protein